MVKVYESSIISGPVMIGMMHPGIILPKKTAGQEDISLILHHKDGIQPLFQCIFVFEKRGGKYAFLKIHLILRCVKKHIPVGFAMWQGLGYALEDAFADFAENAGYSGEKGPNGIIWSYFDGSGQFLAQEASFA